VLSLSLARPLVGISTAYYTWLQQGRPFDISVEILGAIAGALRLRLQRDREHRAFMRRCQRVFRRSPFIVGIYW
jgi:hypothetical protein